MIKKEKLFWEEHFLNRDDFRLILGEYKGSQVIVDLRNNPNILVCGIAGCGKTELLKCLAYQSLKKGADNYIIDFKGGIDYSYDNKNYGQVIIENHEMIKLVRTLYNIKLRRLERFKKVGVSNIVEYNKKCKQPLNRILIFIDEGLMMFYNQEILDYKEIIKYLIKLIDAEDKTGIHLIVSVHLSSFLPIEINKNLKLRICGKMYGEEDSKDVIGNDDAVNSIFNKGDFIVAKDRKTIEFSGYVIG